MTTTLRSSCLLTGAVIASISTAFAIPIGGIEFPDGVSSFADVVVNYSPGSPGPTAPNVLDPADALGVPDGSDVTNAPGSVALGVGGSIILEFTNNVLTGSDDATPDLHIFEVGIDVEDTFVEISRDGTVWEDIGKVFGSTSSIDIDSFGFTSADQFRFVRLTDDPAEGQMEGATVGADIDAVGAISSSPVDDSPQLAIVPSGNTAYSDLMDGQGATAYWRLNEASNTKAANSGAAGASADGIYGRNARLDVPGLRSASNDTAIEFLVKSTAGNIMATGFPMPTGAVTISFLVRGEDDMLSYFLGYGVSGSANEFGLGSNNGMFRVVINGTIVDLAAVDVLDGSIHHVAVTWTSATGLTEVFVDGSPETTTTISTGTPMTTGGVLALGQDLDSLTPPSYGFDLTQSFVGALDEFAVFDRVLTPAEIGAQFAAATNPAPTPASEFFLEFPSAQGSEYLIEDSVGLDMWSDFITDIQGNGRKIRFVIDYTPPARFFRLQ